MAATTLTEVRQVFGLTPRHRSGLSNDVHSQISRLSRGIARPRGGVPSRAGRRVQRFRFFPVRLSDRVALRRSRSFDACHIAALWPVAFPIPVAGEALSVARQLCSHVGVYRGHLYWCLPILPGLPLKS